MSPPPAGSAPNAETNGLGIRLIGAAALTGVAAGIGGVMLTVLLHGVQHLAFGYTENTFLTGVERASPGRRVLAMATGGMLTGLGWWALHRWLRPPVTVGEVLLDPALRLPLPEVTIDAILQIVAVGFGASLGREGAPRQIGAALGAWLADRLRLASQPRRTILACGAGAGLAAVYNVPLGGALFTLELLLASAALRDVLPALLSSGLATAVAWPVLGNRPTYAVTTSGLPFSVVVFAVVLGPVAGLVGVGFLRLTSWARSLAPSGWRLPVSSTVAFAAVGALAIPFPALLGNGKGPAQLAFDGGLPLGVFALLMVAKPLATAACLGSGAVGGLLTPALATGALLGALAGGGWAVMWPGTPTAACALVGAAAVLGVTQRAPLCSVVLVVEFTHTGAELLVPLVLGVAGGLMTAHLLTGGRTSRTST